jgi:hypothetical protein
LNSAGGASKKTLLKVGGVGSDRYLIFTHRVIQPQPGEAWILLGYIDAFTWWGDLSSRRIVTVGTERWLAIEEIGAHGSGFYCHGVTWYEVSEKGIVPVLSYQSDLGILSGANPMMQRQTSVADLQYENGITTVVLRTSTSYDVDQYPNLHLWTKQSKAVFVKEYGAQKFNFDSLHSEILEKELDPGYGDAVASTKEEFLKYNYRDLIKIAIGDSKRKAWLVDFLKDCGDSQEKRSLQKALERALP